MAKKDRTKKKRRTRQPSRASRADVFQLYQESVQCPEAEIHFFDRVFNGTNKIECRFRIFIHFAIHDHVKTFDSIINVYKHAFQASELFCYVERLAQEALNTTGTAYNQFIIVAQLIHAKDSNDILQFFITL